ncbi:prolipoprotein diacylglyceryl transferase [Sphingobacterium allocomposti]|uniref:Phosphatidylglycerol--prolipoprotein diacylglyceryl transferase n=2 Tax=Sphingobacterium allocomposti TaxID=415956 RepID=A0A5S5DSU0_9SPHI|nr:prolipoprotein diacylglyceryl transferase [Sphingobacterium composti Yoo et al. 2007 non Ten et al. 2007]
MHINTNLSKFTGQFTTMISILTAIHWNIDPVIFEIGSFGLRYYALCFLAAFVVSYILMLNIFKKEGKSQELLDQLSIYIFLGTLIGARLGHCLFYEFDYYIQHPLEMILPFRMINGNFELTGFQGLASHGGAIGILTALWLFSRKTKTDFMWITDRLILVVPLAGAFVRLGNFFNSEIIGLPASVPWAVVFEKVDAVPRHPAQLYEALAYVVIFVILWTMYQRNRKPKAGYLFGVFLVLLFGARFALEFFKENQEAFEDGMKFNMGQLLSIPFMLGGLYLIFRKPKEISK